MQQHIKIKYLVLLIDLYSQRVVATGDSMKGGLG